METKKRLVLCLLRNDLRLHDNEVLLQGYNNGDFMLPVYCFDPRQFQKTRHYGFAKTGPFRAKFLTEAVEDLRKTLMKHGSNLYVTYRTPEETVAALVKKWTESYKISLVLQQEAASEELEVEKSLQNICETHQVSYHTIWGSTLYHTQDVPFPISKVPDTYTQFRKLVETQCQVRPELKMPKLLKPAPSEMDKWGEIPSLVSLGVAEPHLDPRTAFPFRGGETTGLERLRYYYWESNSVAQYKTTRNGLVGADYSTKFSPWLSLGCISPRRISSETRTYEAKRTANDSTYWVIFELLWRDYFRFVTLKYGTRIFYASGIMGKNVNWKKDEKQIQAWKDGNTGVPFVDSNMRELLLTGWMSNRGRQNVASFLVKDLGIDWRVGAEWFESYLLDHDVYSNYGNWNYSAGIGNDPRENRHFNMIKQATDYDANGDYVRLWVPELKAIAGTRIHAPWMLSNQELARAELQLGATYPKPITISPQWGKHISGLGRGATTSKPLLNGQQRGIDFYFKSATTLPDLNLAPLAGNTTTAETRTILYFPVVEAAILQGILVPSEKTFTEMAKALTGLAAKAPALMKGVVDYSTPRLKTFWHYARIELAPPTPADVPKISEGLNKLLVSARTGKWKQVPVKEAWLNTLITMEIAFWFFVGECIGKGSIVGYKV